MLWVNARRARQVELKKAKMGLTLMAIVFWMPFGMQKEEKIFFLVNGNFLLGGI